jgi:hypothetical protein
MGDVHANVIASSDRSGASLVRRVAVLTTAALVGGAIVYLLCKMAAGDEPPIRVRGGSIHFEILAESVAWGPQNETNPDPKKWVVGGDSRRTEGLLVYVAPDSLVRCGGVVHKKNVRKVQFWYGEGNHDFIEVHASGRKTKVDSRNIEPTKPRPKELKYGNASDFVRRITIENHADWCRFSAEDQLDGAIIAEDPEN